MVVPKQDRKRFRPAASCQQKIQSPTTSTSHHEQRTINKPIRWFCHSRTNEQRRQVKYVAHRPLTGISFYIILLFIRCAVLLLSEVGCGTIVRRYFLHLSKIPKWRSINGEKFNLVQFARLFVSWIDSCSFFQLQKRRQNRGWVGGKTECDGSMFGVAEKNPEK